ncbi:MAG: radical SAM family heme chaperone HemW [Pseudanabaenaceae cyanobacterium]
MSPTSLYVHIPFCRRRCFYCDFAIAGDSEPVKERYVAALQQELAVWQGWGGAPLQTVFFGGGTPSLLSPAQLGEILAAIARVFGIAADAEISLEANPGTLTVATARAWRSLGFNRVSLGVQAFQDELLQVCGRGHTVAAVDEAVAAVQQAGFANFNLDLLMGLPGQTLAQWEESLQRAIALQPTHVSMYDLILEPGTVFARRFSPAAEDLTLAMYDLGRERLLSAGFEHYEISNLARPGYRCAHNLTYWQGREFYGVGNGAASLVDGCRWERPRALKDYLTWVAGLQEPPLGDRLSAGEHLFEVLMQGLRLEEGVPQSTLAAFPKDWVARAAAVFAGFVRQGLAEGGDRWRLRVPAGWLVSDTLVAQLYAVLVEG